MKRTIYDYGAVDYDCENRKKLTNVALHGI